MKQSLEQRFWSKVQRGGPDECWLWTGTAPDGYGQLHSDGKMVKASHVSWELAHGVPFPDGKYACHTCDNSLCVNPEHIWAGTQSENVRDAIAKGRWTWPFGSGHSQAKLTEREVKSIRWLYEWTGATQKELAKQYGVSRQTVSRIVRGDTWKKVEV